MRRTIHAKSLYIHRQGNRTCDLSARTFSSINYIDTIRIKKEDIPHFESVDCQASYFHTITDVSYTNDIIDSIVINNRNVNYDAKTTHFKLYLKARR